MHEVFRRRYKRVLVGGLVLALATPASGSATAMAATVTCDGFEATIVGTGADDVLIGTTGPDVIAGLGGNDRIDGLAGADVICGGAGSDALRGGTGADFVRGGVNAPLTAGLPVPEDLWGGPGDDVIDGEALTFEDDPSALDRVHFDEATRPMLVDMTEVEFGYGRASGEGDDLLVGVDVVYGSAFDDTMYGGGGEWDPVIEPDDERYDDRFYGLGGNDYLLGRGGRDELFGGSGADDLVGGADVDGLHGGSGDDRVSGGLGDDLADGDAGDDVLDGDEDRDYLDGGVGDDRVRGGDDSDVLSDPAGVDVADAGPDAGYCSLSFETRINCRSVFGEQSAARVTSAPSRQVLAFTRTCDGQEATIVGTTDRDRLVGTPGDDVIVGGPGEDTIRGRGGDDIVCAGSDGDWLYGGSGNDRLFGQADGYNDGAEEWFGDSIWGGAGDDLFDVGRNDARNVAYFTDSPGPIKLAGNTVTGFGTDTLVGVLEVVGSSYDDAMVDGPLARALSGSAGDDLIEGHGGNDVIKGELGDDVILGGSGDDRLSGYEGANRVLGGSGADFLLATSGPDVLLGGSGDDELDSDLVDRGVGVRMGGGSGDDRFYGGRGIETVDGGWHRAGDLCFSGLDTVFGCEFVRPWP